MIDERFKLQTMEYGVPSIVISKNGIFISKNLYKKLNESKYVQIYLAEETKEMAIVPCTKNDTAAIELRIVNNYARISNKDFIIKLATLMGTTFEKMQLRIVGVAVDNYYVFDLKDNKSAKKNECADE